MATTRESRSKGFKVNLTPTMFDKLTALAERYGISPNALSSMAIAEYVAQKSAVFDNQQEAMEKVIASMLSIVEPSLKADVEATKKVCEDQE